MFTCSHCSHELSAKDDEVLCSGCGTKYGRMEDGIVIFDDCLDKHSFFEKQAIERLDRFYKGYDRGQFLEDLKKVDLWQMDEGNKRVGIAKKFWWEPHIGKIENKLILELGCGVNYIVPYFMECDNKVVAFDICRESVEYSKQILTAVGARMDNITYAVADAREVRFPAEFDIINISNVLHHIDDKPAVFKRAYDALKPDGKLIIVEPNYYYPPRWIIETDVFDPINFVKKYFVDNDLIEKGEKAIIFNNMIGQLENAGFTIDVCEKDDNYLGYFTVYWVKEMTGIARAIFLADSHLFTKIMPRAIAPFQYIIASKGDPTATH